MVCFCNLAVLKVACRDTDTTLPRQRLLTMLMRTDSDLKKGRDIIRKHFDANFKSLFVAL